MNFLVEAKFALLKQFAGKRGQEQKFEKAKIVKRVRTKVFELLVCWELKVCGVDHEGLKTYFGTEDMMAETAATKLPVFKGVSDQGPDVTRAMWFLQGHSNSIWWQWDVEHGAWVDTRVASARHSLWPRIRGCSVMYVFHHGPFGSGENWNP